MIRKLRTALHNMLHLDRSIGHGWRDAQEDMRLMLKRMQYETLFLQSTAAGVAPMRQHGERIVVSLTSYGRRIYNVHLAIESIMQQTLRADRIVLWLDQDEFTVDSIPAALKRQIERGLDVRFCRDIGPYKKLVPSLELYPDDIIVTIDDDNIYPPDMLDRLIACHKLYPDDVVGNWATIVAFNSEQVDRSIKWETPSSESIYRSKVVHLLGMGGILYPPHSLHADVTDMALARKLAPRADDFWFKIQSLRNGRLCCSVPLYKDIFDYVAPIKEPMDKCLYDTNIYENDAQLQAILQHYGITKSDFIN